MKQYQEQIPLDLEVLIPKFFANVQLELQEMLACLENQDWETLTRLGHSLKGAGRGYGFLGLADIGLAIENNGKAQYKQLCQESLQQLKLYLQKVEVEFV